MDIYNGQFGWKGYSSTANRQEKDQWYLNAISHIQQMTCEVYFLQNNLLTFARYTLTDQSAADDR